MNNNGSDVPVGRLRTGQLVMRIGGIAVLLAACAGLFAWSAGWLTPSTLTPASLVNTFEYLNGKHHFCSSNPTVRNGAPE
jgi:hypothetical protein